MRVVLSEEAQGDLARIGDHIAQDNPVRALSFVQELVTKARNIGDLPHGFAIVPRYAHLGIRRRSFGNYGIFYRVDADCVTIVHILHGARNCEAWLFPDD